MRIPIPDDWDGETWSCIQIQWPDSTLWRAILSGLLTLPTYGRYWDEKTGSIIDTIAIGKAIWHSNFPYIDCAGEIIENGITEPPAPGRNSCIDESDFDMPCTDITQMLKIEDNILYGLNGCCEWEEIGEVGSQTAAPTVVIPPDIDLNETGIYACGKAEELAEFLVRFADEAWDESDNILPLFFVHHMQNFLDVDLKNAWTQIVQNQALIMKSVVVPTAGVVSIQKDEAIPADMTAQLTCKLLSAMTDTETDDKAAIASAYQNAVDLIFPVGAIPNGPFINNWWTDIGQAMGQTLMHDIAQAGGYSSGNCDCVDGSPYQEPHYDGLVWFNGAYSVLVETQGATWTVPPAQTALNRMNLELTGGINENFQEASILLEMSAIGLVQEIEFNLPLNSVILAGYYPAENYSDTSPTTLANYVKPTVNQANPTYIYDPVTDTQKVIVTWAAPVDLDTNQITVHTKLNPKDQSPVNNIFDFDVVIVYAGPLR